MYFNDLTISYHDQDEQIFYDKAIMQLGFEILRMKGLKKNKKFHAALVGMARLRASQSQ